MEIYKDVCAIIIIIINPFIELFIFLSYINLIIKYNISFKYFIKNTKLFINLV